MPNKKGGKKYKKGKRNIYTPKELITKTESEEYACITSKLGNGRFNLSCQDGKQRMGIISGKMRKRVWVNLNDCVLIAKWEFQDEKCNIIHKYSDNEINSLIDNNELEKTFIKQSRVNDFLDEFDIISSDEDEDEDEEDEDEDEYEDGISKSKLPDINIDEI